MSRYQVREGSFEGEPAVILADHELGLEATVLPGIGSNLISLAQPSLGMEYLYAPPSLAELRRRPTRFGNPVLLPPNRIWEGKFFFGGRNFTLPVNRPPHHIHGLIHSLPWRRQGQGAEPAWGAWVQTVMDSRDHESFRTVFTQNFRLLLTFTLRDGFLRLAAEAVNEGPEVFPFGLGYHTYFGLPTAAGQDLQGYRLSLPAHQYWELRENFPTGRRLPLAEEQILSASRVSELRLDDVFTDLAPGESEIRARLWHEDTGLGIEFASDRQFPHWVVWSGPESGSPFVCLEPYTCVTNAVNLSLPLERTGLVALAPGSTWQGSIEFRPFNPGKAS